MLKYTIHKETSCL